MEKAAGRTERLDQRTGLGAGCVLSITEGPDRGATHVLAAGQAVIGSAEGADFRLQDTTVSGQHVRIEVTSDGILVVDLGSTNGTRYLGTTIREAVVACGAVLQLGRTRMLVASIQPAKGEHHSDRSSYGRITGESPAMRRLYAILERLERFDYPVLIQGPTGVGKELVAHEIHEHSARGREPFEVLDCGAVPRELAESELFGHVRGAFTGAVGSHDGVFARASGGTVFLDEIGELPLELQPKLLRVLESRQFRPVGATRYTDTNVRVVAATHRSLGDDVAAGRFREDLYFRLNVVAVPVPPLKERREDIPALVRHFVKELGAADLEITAETMELFTCGYDWPGNARELRNAIMRVLSLGTVPETIRPKEAPAAARENVEVDVNEPYLEARKRVVDAFEHDYLAHQLRLSENNIAQAARQSGMDRSHFKRLLRRHGLLDKPKAGEDEAEE